MTLSYLADRRLVVWQAQLSRLSLDAQRSVLAIIETHGFNAAILTAYIISQQARAATQASRALREVMELDTGRTRNIVSPTPSELVDQSRTAAALATILAGRPEAFRGRTVRMARGEVERVARDSQTAGMAAAEDIVGWTRRTDSSPCALCRSLDDGAVLPADQRMVDHPGCSCIAQPVTTRA